MTDERDIYPSPLSEMLEQYREGERGMPTYDELAALLNAQPRVFRNTADNEQLAHDAQALVDADVAALPKDCSGTQASCPDNEGYGCACSPVAAAPQVHANGVSDDTPGIQAVFNSAAPQVVADERTVLDSIADLFSIGTEARKEPGVILANVRNTVKFANLLHAVESEFFMNPDDENECLVNCWGSTEEQYLTAMRAALAAAPGQAQDPVPEAAQQNGGLVRAALIDLMVLERQATSACDGFNAQRDCNLRFARARKALADSADTAPVQTVAVPDGWTLVPSKSPTEAMLQIDGYPRIAYRQYLEMLAAAPAAPAAPAAQGDDFAKRLAVEKVELDTGPMLSKNS